MVSVLSACGSDAVSGPDGSETGKLAIRVHVDTYLGRSLPVTVNGETFEVPFEGLTLDALSPGTYDVWLSGPPDDCFVPEPNLVSVAVTAGATMHADFEVFCMGAMRVRTGTTGTDLDGNGFVLIADGLGTIPIGIDDERESGLLRAGLTYPVELSDVHVNCMAEGENPRSIVILPADTVEVLFQVSCITPPLPAPSGHVLFHKRSQDGLLSLHVYDFASQTTSRILEDFRFNGPASPSRDGSLIVFAWDQLELTTMRFDGTDWKGLGVLGALRPEWSPDNQKIVFAASPGGYDFAPTDIWTVNADGSDPTNLTNTPLVDERDPTWSPDGVSIAFSIATSQWDTWIMDTAGGDLRLVVENAVEPAWSPDGRELAFSRDSQIFVVNLETGTERRLTNHGGGSPAWSPDGLRIVYIAGYEGAGGSVVYYMSAADGTGRTVLSETIPDSGGPGWW